VNPKYIKGGIAKKFWSLGALYFKTAGFQYLYCRASNRVTTKVLKSFGGVV
jgi:hypothetical protein